MMSEKEVCDMLDELIGSHLEELKKLQQNTKEVCAEHIFPTLVRVHELEKQISILEEVIEK